MVEHLGSGMNRILSFYKKEVFLFSGNFSRIVFKKDNNPITAQETAQETVKLSTKDKIVHYIQQNKTITRDELAVQRWLDHHCQGW